MRSLKILLVLFLVFIASSLANQATIDSEKSKKGKLLGDRTKQSQPTPTLTSSLAPAKTTQAVKPEATQQTQSDSESVEYVYPGSKAVKTDGSSFYLESDDNPKVITDWYKDQVADFGAKSSVSTSTNGNVLNRISASGGNQKIDVEIKKAPESDITRIIVTITSP